MMQSTCAAPALSPLNGKPILLNFDGAEMSSDAGLTLLRQVERRADLAGLVAKRLTDLRDPSKTHHSLEDIIRFRIMMIAAGYEDGVQARDRFVNADASLHQVYHNDADFRGGALAFGIVADRLAH